MAHHRGWIERTFTTVVLPAVAPVATVRSAGVARCQCAHTPLVHGPAAGACRSCACAGYVPAATAA